MSGRVLVTEAPSGLTSMDAVGHASGDLHIVPLVMNAGIATGGGAAGALLAALGARDIVMGKVRHELDNVSLAALWLTAHRTETLVVAGLTDNASHRNLSTIARATASSCTDLVVVADHGYLGHALAALRPTAPRVIAWEEIPPFPVEPDDPEPPSWTAYSEGMFAATDVFTYLDAARRLLPHATFEAHYGLYVDAHCRMTEWVAAHGASPLTREATVIAMTTLVNEQHDWDQVVTAVNGAIAGMLSAGWLMTVDFDVLRCALNRNAHPHWSAHEWRTLRAYRDPERAAVLCLYMLGMNPRDLRSVTLDEAVRWDQYPSGGIRGHIVPEVAEPYVRAQVLARLSDGADPADALLPLGHRRIALDVNNARSTLGLNLGDFPYSDSEPMSARRVPADAFRIEELT